MIGKAILVTGASSGIGRRTAQMLADHGARVALAGRSVERLDETASKLAGHSHCIFAADVGDQDGATEFVDRVVADFGTLDGVFHSAGVEMVRPMKMTKGAQTAQIFGSSIFAGLGIARAASRKGVLNDGASLLFMSSVAGARGTAGMVAYSAAKAAVDGMVRSLACELAARNIRVNSIAAGAIKTEMHERLSRSLNAEGIAEYEGRHLLGFGTSEDVANAALFLMSDASRWITGTSMAVDGGYAAR